MLIGFIYQIANGNSYMLREINIRATANLYHNQVKAVFKEEDKIVCRWKIKKRFK